LDETTTSRFSKKIDTCRKEKAISHANILGRTFEEVLDIYDALHQIPIDRFTRDFWLGKLAIEETIDNDKRTITFSPILGSV
jgi:hypothetical protein